MILMIVKRLWGIPRKDYVNILRVNEPKSINNISNIIDISVPGRVIIIASSLWGTATQNC